MRDIDGAFVVLDRVQENLEAQMEMLKRQKLYKKSAEKVLGPSSSWPGGDEDGTPATAAFTSKLN